MTLVGRLAVLLAAVVGVASGSRGYSLAFTEVASVVGLKRGFVDFADPGMDAFDSELTISMWMRVYSRPRNVRVFTVQWVNGGDGNLINPFTLEAGLPSMFFFLDTVTYRDDRPPPDEREWHHYGLTIAADGVVTVYIDGEVYVVHKLKKPGQLQGGRTLISVGGQVTHSQDAVYPEVGPLQGLHGEIDELSLWSRALTAEEIKQLMRKPLNTSALPREAALAYTFDVEHCDLAGSAAADCGQSEVVRNYGSAGRDYDLLRGKLKYAPGEASEMYKLTSDPPEMPPLHKFTKPVFHASSVPLADEDFNVAAPTVLQAVPGGGGVDVPLSFGGYTASAVVSLPARAAVFVATSADDRLTPAAAGDELGLATEMRVQLDADVPATGTAFQLRLLRKHNGAQDEVVTHDVHVVPLAVPKLLVYPMLVEGREDAEIAVRAGRMASADSGERVVAAVVRTPTRGKLYNVGWESLGAEGPPLKAGDNVTDVGGELIYVADKDQFGVDLDSLEVVFRSEISGLESEPLLIKLSVFAVDDLPQSTGSNDATVVEDSEQGVRIALNASDAEGKAGLVITRLPEKGKLFVNYYFDNNQTMASSREIDEAYELYNVGDNVTQQYVYQVRKVSSYWGSGTNTGYHAVNIIGSPRCVRQGQSECPLDDRFTGDNPAPIEVGDLVRGPPSLFGGAAAPAAPDTLLILRVTRVHEPASPELEATYDVQEEPTYTNGTVAGVRTRCRLVGMNYPEDCPALDPGAPLLTATGLKRSELTGFHHSVWTPRYRNADSDMWFNSSDAGEFLGSQYATAHNPRLNYEQVNFREGDASFPKPRPYTDFIEVEYQESVFPISVQVGETRGAGSVVGVYALNPDSDEWVQMYSGAPQVTEGLETSGRGLYHVFQERQCRESFRTKFVRLEIDTVGITDWNYFDYIKLTGAKEVQSAMIMDGVTDVTYVPDKDAFGDDSFSFSAFDCGGDELRQSGDRVVAVRITPMPDAPVVEVKPAGTIQVHSTNSLFNEEQVRVVFELEASDVDAERLTVEWEELPSLGVVSSEKASVALGETSGKLLAESADADVGKTLRVPLTFEPKRCTERGLQQPDQPSKWSFTPTDKMRLRVTDSSGASTEHTVEFKVVCEDYSYDFTIDTIAIALATFNIVCALACIAWALVKREHPIVKAAQLPFLLLIALGCIVSSCSILALTVHDQAGPPATSTGGNAAADRACRLAASLFMMGFMLTFSSLFAKMYRVYRVFGVLLPSAGGKRRLQVTLTTGTIARIICAFCAVEVLIIVVWVAADPLYFRRTKVGGDADRSVGFCYSHNSSYFLAVTCLYHLSVLFVGAWLCYKTMGVSSAFSEAKYVSVAIIGNLEMLLIAIPVLIIVSDSPGSSLFVQAAVIALNDLGVLACIFLPKIFFQVTGYVEDGHGAHVIHEQRSASMSMKKGSRSSESSSAGPPPPPVNSMTML